MVQLKQTGPADVIILEGMLSSLNRKIYVLVYLQRKIAIATKRAVHIEDF